MSRVLSFLLRYGVALGVGVLVTLQVVQWFRPSPDGTLSSQDPSPRVLEPVRDIEKLAPAVTLPPQEIVALKPDKAALARIEKKLGAPLPASVTEGRAPLLSVKEIGELCHGGEAGPDARTRRCHEPGWTKDCPGDRLPQSPPLLRVDAEERTVDQLWGNVRTLGLSR